MAEGFEPYHVPQQSRRDKLRIVAQNHQPDLHASCSSLLPLYDPSLLPSDHFLASAAPTNSLSCKENDTVSSVRQQGVVNLMGFVGGGGGIVNASSSSSTSHYPYLDPQSSLPLNPTSSIQDVNGNNNLFLYPHHTLQNLRDFEQPPYGGGAQVVGFKPEPLSLSLSSHHHANQSNLPLELNLQKYGAYMVPGIDVGGSEVSKSSVPLGPFTGYASILKGSRFLRPAQQLLEEFCDVGRGIYSQKTAAAADVDDSLMDPPVHHLSADGALDDSLGGETRRKKSRLISMLDEVYRRYKQYYQQMQAVVASFECVAGLGNAAPYANLALKAMSKHFKSLKNAITDQLQFTSKAHGQMSHGKEETARFGNTDRGHFGHRPVQNSGFVEHQPVWRPQRGLPERAVTVLRAWLFEHFLHPYPTDMDKQMLAKQTGLSRNQVSNWFINARVRLWKPMVEEIHMLETRQAQKAVQREERNPNRPNDPVPPSNALAMENPSTSTQRVQDIPSKRTRNELPDLPMGSGEPLNLSYNSLSSQQHVGIGNTGVSLTLGLHQNNGMGLSEPFPISAAQRYGLGIDSNGEGYMMGGFEVQNRHFGRDVIGGQLLHDFVG